MSKNQYDDYAKPKNGQLMPQPLNPRSLVTAPDPGGSPRFLSFSPTFAVSFPPKKNRILMSDWRRTRTGSFPKFPLFFLFFAARYFLGKKAAPTKLLFHGVSLRPVNKPSRNLAASFWPISPSFLPNLLDWFIVYVLRRDRWFRLMVGKQTFWPYTSEKQEGAATFADSLIFLSIRYFQTLYLLPSAMGQQPIFN